MTAPTKASPNAIGKWSTLSGKPLITAVAMCPIPVTAAPSIGPKYSAAKKPGAESNATVGIGPGRRINEPITDSAQKTAILASRYDSGTASVTIRLLLM